MNMLNRQILPNPLQDRILAIAKQAKQAAREISRCSTEIKNRALVAMADALLSQTESLLAENAKDVTEARKQNLATPFIERLTLTPGRISEMAAGLREVSSLSDPVGEIIGLTRRPNGMQVGRMRVPIGLIGIIYESRPNVTADVAALCLKSGNAVLLRGGSEALHSNRAIVSILQGIASSFGIPSGAISFVNETHREAISILLHLEGLIDLVIPRGGAELMKLVTEESRVPVIRHDRGLCHTFVDASAELALAVSICCNAKVQRPAVCNAMETLLVHQEIAPRFLPELAKHLEQAGCLLRGCPKTCKILPTIAAATEADWTTEYLDLILAIKIVDDLDEAMAHISRYGSQHSEAMITRDHNHAMRFLNEVDASAVFVNASTRLNDGFQLGLGAEMGISTSRIHARGPMGLEALTCTKFIVLGNGQIRE